MAKAKSAVPDGYRTVTVVLTLDDAKSAIDWYRKALGAEELMRSAGPDGKIMHGELRIGDTIVMVHDAMMGAQGPKAAGASPASLWLYVEDCDALFARAVAAGAQVRYPMDDQFWGDRQGTIEDPAGYLWHIASRKEDLTPQELGERQREFMKKMSAQKT